MKMCVQNSFLNPPPCFLCVGEDKVPVFDNLSLLPIYFPGKNVACYIRSGYKSPKSEVISAKSLIPKVNEMKVVIDSCIIIDYNKGIRLMTNFLKL